MNTTADSTRYLRTLWRGDKPWHWLALYVGHVQPLGYRNRWHSRWRWQFHLTPIHVSRDGSKWTAGLCFGRRTIFVFKHA